MNRYKIAAGPDGTYWVSLQPLLQDIIEQLADPHLPEHARLPIESVKTFVEALIMEGRQQDWDNAKDRNDEASYRDTLIQ